MAVTRRFPGGIVDAQGQRAALRDRQGRLVAVALEGGTLLWRSDQPLAPLLLPPGEVIACTLGPAPVCVALAWAGEHAGRPVWSSQPIGLPSPPDPDLRLVAEARDDHTIAVRWQGAARYRGGAAPGPAVRSAALQGAQGSVVVDRRTGRVTPAGTSRSGPPADPALDDAADTALPGMAANTLAAEDIGARRFELCVDDLPDGRVRTVLRARDTGADRTLWELPIDEAPRTRARPPRP
jgi:hypothetical protein